MNIRQKRLWLVLALGALAVSVAGCGSVGNSGTGGGKNAVSEVVASKVSSKQLVASAGIVPGNAFCGSKPVKIGLADGFGTNSWSAESFIAQKLELAKCKNVSKPIIEIGQGDLQTAISQINSLVTQGVNAMVVIPDFGKSELPAIKAATAAGVKVVTWGTDPGGVPGKDYVTFVNTSQVLYGYDLGRWLVKADKGQGNIVFLGGPANAGSIDVQILQGLHRAFAGHPGMKLLLGNNWVSTQWTASSGQQAMSSILAKYPKIDGIIGDYGASTLGAIRAFQAAGRPLVPIATSSENDIACTYYQLKGRNPRLELATQTTKNWLGRETIRKVLAAVAGKPDNEPSVVDGGIAEDSIAGPKPKCDKSFPPDWDLTSNLTHADVTRYGVKP